jgi:hypothetical protein
MNPSFITCPKCGANIELTEAFTHQVEEKLREEYDKKLLAEKAKLEGRIKKEAEDKLGLELKDLKTQIEEKDKRLQAADKSELDWRKRQREMEEREKNLQLEVQRKLDEEREKIKKEAQDKLNLDLKDLKGQLAEKDKYLREAQDNELELRKRQQALEEQEKSLKLELQRTLDQERKKIWEDASKKVLEEHQLKDAGKDKQMDDMRRQIEELKRKADLGSQQAQGEVLEIELENLLIANFRTDEIKPVPKGIKGADVVQGVLTQLGNFCGTILWESKRTKAWSDGWIQKLKDDQREVKASIAVIVSTALPREIKNIGNIDGVWITDFNNVIGLAMALRHGLVEVARTKASLDGKKEKMEIVYTYLSGQEFRQRVEAIVEAFVGMKTELDAEKRAMEKIWAKREQQMNRIVKNTAGLYGDLQGIIGGALQPIARLQLPSGDTHLEK